MSRRFLCPGIEEDVFAGDWGAILGILEDAHRWAVDWFCLSLCVRRRLDPTRNTHSDDLVGCIC